MSTQTKENLNLDNTNIKNIKTVYRNLSYEQLFEHETNPELESYAKGYETELGAITVDTGKFTGRSAKDKYIVRQKETEDNIWWKEEGSDNTPLSEENWSELKKITSEQLSGKKLYVMDGFCGANKETRLAVRLITEVALASSLL